MYDPSATISSPVSFHNNNNGPSQWTPSTSYYPGNIVWFAGTFWRCESGHTSARGSGGAPTNTLHLWTPVSSNGYFPSNQQQQQQQQQQTRHHQQQHHLQSKPEILSPRPQHMPSKPPLPTLETLHKKDSNDSASSGETITGSGVKLGGMDFFTARASESRRALLLKEEGERSGNAEEMEQELMGKRVWRVGGVGVWSYSLNPNVERQKRALWKKWSSNSRGKEDWLAAARARTAFYNDASHTTRPLVQWKIVEKSGDIPPDALAIGHESDGQLLYAVRAWFNGGIHLGKAASRSDHSASVSWGGTEHLINTFEVLCGAPDPTLLKWMTFRHGEKCDVHGWMPVEGGREAGGEALLIAKGSYENGQHPGKCLINDDHACIGWGGGEVWVRPFEVLAYSTADRR